MLRSIIASIPNDSRSAITLSPACRFCGAPLSETFADLGLSPPANAYVPPEEGDRGEIFYPLHARVCSQCFLVQLPEVIPPQQIFTDYAYFSSYSDSWLRHAEEYAAAMVRRFELHKESQVVEVASNDGYLLQYFQQRGVSVLGIDPAENVAQAAIERGIPTLVRFFGREVATELVEQGTCADLLVGNNVLAHVPDMNDFVAGLATVLAPKGVLTMEFPHLLRLIQENQFDTIYHEHYSYLSLGVVRKIFGHHGLHLFDVDELPTHGGSLRVYAERQGAGREEAANVGAIIRREEDAGLTQLKTYGEFGEKVRQTKHRLLRFLIEAREEGRRIVGYGAAAKGNTLLNYCGIRTDLLECVVDRSPHKQGHLLPGTRIPIVAPERIFELRPDLILILPWNLREEITTQLAEVRDWGARFVVPIPEVTVLS